MVDHTDTGEESPSRFSLTAWRHGERGMSEVAGAIFVLPIIAFLIFALIDTGINLRYRTLVDNITQNTTRALANDGAQYWARTTVLPTKPNGAAYDTGTFMWQTYGTDQLKALCGAGGNRCTNVANARMTCTVAATIPDSVGARSVARNKNTKVSCTSTFPYKPVSPLSNNPATSLGFSTFLTKPIDSTATGLTTVGANG